MACIHDCTKKKYIQTFECKPIFFFPLGTGDGEGEGGGEVVIRSTLPVLTLFLAGNFYEHLFKSSAEAAEKLGSSRVEAVTDIAKPHEPFFTSSMPTYL